VLPQAPAAATATAAAASIATVAAAVQRPVAATIYQHAVNFSMHHRITSHRQKARPGRLGEFLCAQHVAARQHRT